ncbi:hypothetical protein ACFTWS_03415 [Streptomyces sp. NPDC057027]|uniref:hypothetical protein n=1 Tax=unclassified Streptomyces TaxID=2593676 RepID=UPI0036434113
MTDEPGVDERDALARRDGGQQGAGLLGAGGDPDVEAERPQITVERGSGCRRAGEDGGRQTNSLLEADGGAGGAMAAPGAAVWPGTGRRHVG